MEHGRTCCRASSLIDFMSIFLYFFVGLCFHQKLFWYCPPCLLDGCTKDCQLQWLLQTLVLHFQWRWVFSAILRGTVITSIKETCAWDSGSATALHMETLMATQDLIQCPVYLLKKFLKLKLKRDFRLKWLMRSWVIMSSYTTESKNR